jgi:AcrR family transcriptional regulator
VDPGKEDLWPLFLEGPGRHGRPARDSQRSRRGNSESQDFSERSGSAPPQRRGRGLSRDEIVRAAVRVADAEGSESINMRRIARELNAGTMSLYWHIASKEQLLDLMLDEVEGEADPPGLTGDWRPDLRAFAVSNRAALHRHPWLMDFIGGRPPLGPNHLRNLEHSLAVLDQLGLDTLTRISVLTTIGTYVMGTVLREIRESLVERRDEEQLGDLTEEERDELLAAWMERLRATGQFTRFTKIFDEGIDPDAAETRDARFEFGLDCLLDGLAARLAKFPPHG